MRDVEATYRRYFPLIREKCRRMLGDADAQDVAQETFVRFWDSAMENEDMQRTTAWIYRTCTRLMIDRLRERKRRPASADTLHDLPAAGTDADELLSQRRELVQLIDALPSQELEVAMLSRIDRLTHDEIAEVLGISDRTVRRCLARLGERVGTR
ncbi:MAG TPA: sigma-70 family RNA polymerase sigma factor [Myxococcales bacterium]|nr:sigma-70 family RNA polymerase sigma factor [Myxococcales bacterium]